MIEGLKRAVEIIKKEKEYAIQFSPQMALGMARILSTIEEEIEVEENN